MLRARVLPARGPALPRQPRGTGLERARSSAGRRPRRDATCSRRRERQVRRLLAGESEPTLAGSRRLGRRPARHRSGAFPPTARWHYVNLDARTCRYDAAARLPRRRLRDRRDPGASRRSSPIAAGRCRSRAATHLKFLVHLVADVHQPLHAGGHDDKGGNRYQVSLRTDLVPTDLRTRSLRRRGDGHQPARGLGLRRAGVADLGERAYADRLDAVPWPPVAIDANGESRGLGRSSRAAWSMPARCIRSDTRWTLATSTRNVRWRNCVSAKRRTGWRHCSTTRSAAESRRVDAYLNRQVLARPADDVGGGHRARLSRELATADEQRQRGNAANAEALAQCRFGLGVDLRQPHARLQLHGGLLELRRHHPAGPTPRCPEVDQQWQAAAPGMHVEMRRIQRYRVPVEQRAVALAADRRLAQSRRRHAVERVAVWAGNQQRIRHAATSSSRPAFQRSSV